MIYVLLLFHDFVHFLCWPKENEPKERAFLARITVIFACGKTSFAWPKIPPRLQDFLRLAKLMTTYAGRLLQSFAEQLILIENLKEPNPPILVIYHQNYTKQQRTAVKLSLLMTCAYCFLLTFGF
ncbi:MAG: hypothetical protein CFE24_11450 [Flavobacterium sp. BFFFF2]|nr:MAG: hypothetical protein CFE24_11450 [Flavobacterium sp. BFFFF2]